MYKVITDKYFAYLGEAYENNEELQDYMKNLDPLKIINEHSEFSTSKKINYLDNLLRQLKDALDESLTTSLHFNVKSGETHLSDGNSDSSGFESESSALPRPFLSKGKNSPGLLEVLQKVFIEIGK